MYKGVRSEDISVLVEASLEIDHIEAVHPQNLSHYFLIQDDLQTNTLESGLCLTSKLSEAAASGILTSHSIASSEAILKRPLYSHPSLCK